MTSCGLEIPFSTKKNQGFLKKWWIPGLRSKKCTRWAWYCHTRRQGTNQSQPTGVLSRGPWNQLPLELVPSHKDAPTGQRANILSISKDKTAMDWDTSSPFKLKYEFIMKVKNEKTNWSPWEDVNGPIHRVQNDSLFWTLVNEENPVLPLLFVLPSGKQIVDGDFLFFEKNFSYKWRKW